MALNLRNAIAGLRAQLAQVDAAIADFERLRSADEVFREERARRRAARAGGNSRAAGASPGGDEYITAIVNELRKRSARGSRAG
jgi:hypothetical protein